MTKLSKDYTSLIGELRTKIRVRLAGGAEQEYRENIRKGLYPYEGAWLTPSQIEALHAYWRKRNRTIVVELIALLALLFAASLTFSLLMSKLLLPR